MTTPFSSVLNFLKFHQITEVLHFTTNLGLVGCLATDLLLPRSKLKDEEILEHILFHNTPFRPEESPEFDKSENWIDYVNMSISAISSHLFRYSSKKWHAGKDISWFIMSFDISILEHDGVYFSTTNNKYEFAERASGVPGLSALFRPTIQRRVGWTVARAARPLWLTTCEQAEVLYPHGVALDHLRTVYAQEGEDADWANAVLATYGRTDVKVCIDPAKFQGFPN
jgi:ssDNA thymidine ADP-ribosyltransferase, DarT